MAKYCIKCGAPLNSDSKFCLKCGASVYQEPQSAVSVRKAAAEPVQKTNFAENSKTETKTERGGKGKTILFLCIAVSLVIVLFTVPGYLKGSRTDSTGGGNSNPVITNQPSSNGQSTESSSNTLHLSISDQESPNADKVHLVVSDCLVEEPVEYNVTALKQAEDNNNGVKVYRYDVSSEQITGSLNGFMEIRIPYDDTYFASGENPADCLGAYTVDENGVTKPELYEVDTENKEIVIFTPHLSERQVYHYRDAPTAEKYEVNFGNTLVGNLSFDDCAKFIETEGSFYDLDEYENKYYASKGAIELLMNAGFGVPLKLVPPGINNYIYDATGWLGNAFTMLSLGGEYTQSYIAQGLNKMSKLGLYTSYCKFFYCLSDLNSPWKVNGPSREEVLNAYKTTLSTCLDYASMVLSTADPTLSANISMCGAGTFVFTTLIDNMFQEAMYQKMWDMAAVYEYFGDSYCHGDYKPRSNKEWYELFMKIFSKYIDMGKQEYIEEAIDRELRIYAGKFWELSPETVGEVCDDAGYKRMPYPTEAEIKTMTDNYVENLRYRLTPVIMQCERTMLKRLESGALDMMRQAYNNINYKVPMEIKDASGKAKFAGYYFSFDNLSNKADPAIWQGQLDKDGLFSTKFSLNDWITAGVPTTVSLYASAKDMEDGKNIVAKGTFVPAEKSTDITEVLLGELSDELVWVRDQIAYQSTYSNTGGTYGSSEPCYDANGNEVACVNAAVDAYTQKISCAETSCTVTTTYPESGKTETAQIAMPERIITDAGDPKPYTGNNRMFIVTSEKMTEVKVIIVDGSEEGFSDIYLKYAVPAKREGAWFVVRNGKVAYRYTCKSMTDAAATETKYFDVTGEDYYTQKMWK